MQQPLEFIQKLRWSAPSDAALLAYARCTRTVSDQSVNWVFFTRLAYVDYCRPSPFPKIMTCHHGHDDSYPELNYNPGAKWIKDLTRNRLNNFHGGHYSDINLSSVLFTHRLDGPDVVSLHVYVNLNKTNVGTR